MGLWSQIVSDYKDVEAMEKAARDPEYLVVSDWSQYTSDEYWKISTDSGMLVLYVHGRRLLIAPLIPSLIRRLTVVTAALTVS